MKTLLKLTLGVALTCALPAWACTPEEATAKREQLAQEVTRLTEQNPAKAKDCLLYTSPSPRDGLLSRMPSSA